MLNLTLPGLLLLSLVACTKAPSPAPDPIRPVMAVQVGQEAQLTGRSFPGRAKATQEANLAFDVSGKLVERPVKVGDLVKKGELIARLDPKDFEANLKSAEAKLRTAKRNFERGKELLSDNFISQSEYDRLESNVEVNLSKVALARKALADSVMVVPFDGTISNLYVENFEAVLSKKVVARILDSSRIEMVINIPETLITRVHTLEEIKVIFDPFPDHEFVATIEEVSNEASETTRTYPVTLILPQPQDVAILPGMAGKAWATKARDADETAALVIPVEAVFTPDTEAADYVWVIDEASGKVSRQAVEVGRITRGGIELLGGIDAGQWVAVAGVHSLSEGQQVRIAALGD